MQGQGNFSIQVGQDPYARPPAFQQHPATAAPPATSHYGPLAPQPHVFQHVRPSFHPRPDAVSYQHAMTSVPHQGRPAPVASGGMSSSQSYLHHPRPSHISNQITHSYPITDQQPLLWSQNVHQLPPPAPLHGQIAYQLPPSQQTLERELSHQHPSHAPPSLPPPYTSSSTVMMSGPGGSSTIPVREHSHGQSMAPVLPPPPPPPLPPSPPRVPPLPPSSPSSDILSKKDRNLSWNGPPEGNNLVLECQPLGKPVDDTSVGSVVAEAAHSLTDSDMDMDMEDDITYPAEEKNNFFSVNSNNECGSMPQEDYTGEKLQPLQHTGGHRLPEVSVHGSLLSSEASVAKAKGGGSEVAYESGMTGCGQNGNSFAASIKESPFRHENFGQSGELVVRAETASRELAHKVSANPFKIVPDYSSNTTSENEDENLGDVGLPTLNDVSTKSDAENGHDLGSDLAHKSLSESNLPLLPESLTVSPRNVMSADKLAISAGMVGESSDRRCRGQEPDSSGTCIPLQSKDFSCNYDENIGLEEANAQKPDLKSDKLKVDEFGRLVREDVIDSDTSDSPSYKRRYARRARKRSRSQSRSRSPHDRRRRRRSPWRKKERRGHSRSLSPRGRSRSRSPVLRRDSEFGGDKLRREKGQLPECFDFLQGKCYRGTNCRYSHKSEKSRFDRGRQHYWDAPPTLQSPDIDKEGKVATEKKNKDKGGRRSQDMHGLREVNDEKGVPVGSTSQSPDKIDNLSGYAVHETPLGKYNYLIPQTTAKYSDNVPQVVDQQGKRTDDILLSASASLGEALGSTPAHHPADKPDAKQDPASQLYSVESYSMRPYSNQEVSSQPLKELLPSIANHPSPLSIPLPSASQLVSTSFTQPVLQDYSSNPPISQNRLTPENYSTYETSVAYQHSHFPGPLKSLSSSFLPPPPPPPTSAEHSIPQQLQQSLLPSRNGVSSYTSMRNQPTEMPIKSQTGEFQAYSFVREPDQMLHRTDGFGPSSLHASNLTSREGIPCVMGEDHLAGDPVQGSHSSKLFSRAQTNPLLRQPPFKGTYSLFGLGLSSDSKSAHGHSYFQQASYGLQYSAGVHVSEPGTVGSSASRITPDFLERNRPYAHGFVGSKISNYFNPYASTFDVPLSSKLSSNTSVRENDATTNYGAPVGLSSVPVDLRRIGSAGSKKLISSSSVLPADCVSRPDGNQYDPLFDSIEPTSNSLNKADHAKHEITGDSDDLLRFHESGRLLNVEAVKKEGVTTVSSNDSLEKEECGETADVAVGAVLTRTPSDPNDAVDMNAGEFEIDQVKTSGKKKKSKERSMKHFKISIAAFVKEVLKPSWRQGNMSKEAFKTIVKKTVDKVSGAMKSHQIPKSQAKINHYIDSSRGKLTKLVMGYVDKYVKA